MDKRLLVIAGYGGHSGYAYAILHELLRAGYAESLILVARGYEFLVDKFKPLGTVKTLTLPRKPGEPLVKGIHRWMKSLYESFDLVRRYRIGVVFATGSNFSIPPSIVSRFLRGSHIYTIEAIEHFYKPSRSVKILEKLGGRVLLHWDEQTSMYPNGIVVGPVYEPAIYEPRDEGYILVTTGTLGYRELFDTISEINPGRVVLQTGDIDPEPYAKRHHDWIVFKYTSDIHKWISGASIVITQQGVTAATARLAYGKPVIIVYNPRVRLGAPREDIKIYAEKLDAFYIDEPDPKLLRKALESIGKPYKSYPNGAARVAKLLLDDLDVD